MNSLRRNTFFAAAGNFSNTALLAVAMLVIAWFGNREMVGRYSYALAICSPVFLLAHLRLRDVKATQVENSYSLGDFLQLVLMTNTVAILVVVPIGLLLRLDSETLLVAFLIGLWKATIGLTDVIYGYHQGKSNLKLVSKLQLTHSLATAVVFASAFIVTRNLPLALGMLFPVNAVLFAVVDYGTVRGDLGQLSKSEDPQRSERLSRLALSTFPLGLAGAIFSLNMVIPRGLLEHHFSLAEVGVFSALAFFARAGTPIILAFGQASSKQLANSVTSGDSGAFARILWQACKVPLALGVAAIVLGWLVGQQVVTGIYGPEYQTSRLAVVLIAVYATLVYISTVLTYGVIAARRLKSQLLVLSLTVVAVFLCAAFMIPQYGVTGACISLVLSAIVRVIGNFLICFFVVQSLSCESQSKPATTPL